MIGRIIRGGVCLALAATLGGCAAANLGTPVAETQIHAYMNSGNCEILEKTEGSSTLTSILLGLVQIVDGDKVAVLGVKFFEDRYSFVQPNSRNALLGCVTAEDRAYYKALAAAPDADAVAAKAFSKNIRSIPVLWKEERVTFSGKGLRFKQTDTATTP